MIFQLFLLKHKRISYVRIDRNYTTLYYYFHNAYDNKRHAIWSIQYGALCECHQFKPDVDRKCISLSFCDFILLPLPSWFKYVATFSVFKSPVVLSTRFSLNSHNALFIVYSCRIFKGRLRSFERAGRNELPSKLLIDSL